MTDQIAGHKTAGHRNAKQQLHDVKMRDTVDNWAHHADAGVVTRFVVL